MSRSARELPQMGDRRPLPVIIRGWIEDLIRRGELQAGAQLPSEDELAQLLEVSRPTLREALGALEAEGLILRLRGVGTFVGPRALLRNNLDVNFGVTDLIRSFGGTPGAKDVRVEELPASEEDAAALQVAPGDPLLRIERVRTMDGLPVVFSIDVLPSGVLTMPLELEEGSIYSLLEGAGRPVHHGVARIRPATAAGSLAKRLDIPSGALLLVLDQIDYDHRGKPIVHSEEWHVANAFEITVFRKGSGSQGATGGRE